MRRRNRIQALSSELAHTAAKILRQQAPAQFRFHNGVWIAASTGEAWLYAAMPQIPLLWEGENAQRRHAQTLQTMFVELAEFAATDDGKPEFHLLALGWEDTPRAGEAVDPGVQEWLKPVIGQFSVGASLFVVGVKLRSVESRPLARIGSILSGRPLVTERSLSSRRSNEWRFSRDRDIAMSILARAGGRLPTDAECNRMSLWLRRGLGYSPLLEDESLENDVATWDALYGLGDIEFSVPVDFSRFESLEDSLWLADTFGRHDGCVAVSVRGVLATDPLAEHGYEDRTLVHHCSVVFAHRRTQGGASAFTRDIAQACGVESLTLDGDQRVEALAETLPLGQPRLGASRSPRSGMPITVLTRSGIGAFHAVGDEGGAWIGTAMPEHPLVWLDPFAAAKRNAPPFLHIIGDPGRGKTFLMKMVADQMATTDLPVVYVNPKGADSAERFADRAGADFIKVSSLEQGALDPFRFATDPLWAAELASEHLVTCLPSLGVKETAHMAAVLRQAAKDGARCVGEALLHPEISDSMRRQVNLHVEANPLFGLGISSEPRHPWRFATVGSFSVVEFDRLIPLPASFDSLADLGAEERAAVSAVRLVVNAALEQMCAAGKGVLLVDEADAVMSAGGSSRVKRRLLAAGPSHGILPIMASQRPIKPSVVGDAPWRWDGGRVLVLAMEDAEDVQRALALCGLDYSDSKHDFLRLAGPITDPDHPYHNRGALGFYRDLDGRMSAVMVGPLPDDMRLRYSHELPLSRTAV